MIALMPREEWEALPVSGGASGSRAGAGHCPKCEAYRPDPALDGSLVVDPEIHLPSPGMDVDISYYYNSSTITGSPFQNGPYGYDRTISAAMVAQIYGGFSDHVVLQRGNSAVVTYQKDGFGTFVSQTPGVVNTLV